VRREGSSSLEERSRSYYFKVLALALALTITAAIIVQASAAPLAFNGKHVDPRLLGFLGKRTVYVVSSKPLKNAIKKWVFGDIYISKIVATRDDVFNLLKKPYVLSVWGEIGFKAPDPFDKIKDYLKANNGEEKDFSKDYKRILHKATDDVQKYFGRGVTVAVVDTGIDYLHPDFFDENNRTIIKVIVSFIYVTNKTNYIYWDFKVNGTVDELYSFDKTLYEEYGEYGFMDENGHGTHVAGIIAGTGRASNGLYRGIAYGAKLVVLKAFHRDGSSSTELVLNALEWLYKYGVDYGVDVANLSWGISEASDGYDPVSLAASKLYTDKGMFVVAAAGNEGNFPTTIIIPAVGHYVLAVGAFDPYEEKIADFSSLGPTVDFRVKPDVLGAGVDIIAPKSRYNEIAKLVPEWVINSYYMRMSGTSMAAPCVSAVIACYIEYYEFWKGRKPTLENLLSYFENNNIRLNALFKDFISGWGIPLVPE